MQKGVSLLSVNEVGIPTRGKKGISARDLVHEPDRLPPLNSIRQSDRSPRLDACLTVYTSI